MNGLIAPVVKALSMPISMMTMGLFGIVVNAALLLLIAWIASIAKFDFTVGGFPPTLRPRRHRRRRDRCRRDRASVGSVVGMVVRD